MMNSLVEKIVFVPACLLCPCFMAQNKKTDYSWRKVVLSFLIENNYSIIPLPCPESSFSHPDTGLHRDPHGVSFYEKLDGFQTHCSLLSEQVINKILELVSNGYTVAAILGIEHSPTCAVKYMYTHHGMIRRAGVFMERISGSLIDKGLAIPIIGINRRFPSIAIKSISNL